jgi:hypothetical protein
MNYTKGPWEVGDNGDNELYVQRGKQGGFIVRGIDTAKAHADAYIIAAAPDLYECLRSALEFTKQNSFGGCDTIELIDRCTAALAKAEGREV